MEHVQYVDSSYTHLKRSGDARRLAKEETALETKGAPHAVFTTKCEG